MTQLDLPQVSLERYLDLLKRRRWQVIPVSLLGLLVGGLVAFFIPRYYVATTLLVHQMAPGAEVSRNLEDPFRSIVASASRTIPLAIGETIAKLGWEEANAATPFELTENERAIAARLVVNDSNAQDQKRDYAEIVVTYRDRDGARSAKFLNTLVETWIAQRHGEMKAQAERDQKLYTDAFRRVDQALSLLLTDRLRLEQDYGINPEQDPQVRRDQQRRDGENLQRLAADRAGKAVAHAATVGLLESEREQLRGMPPRIKPDLSSLEAMALQGDEALALVARLKYHRRALENLQPGTRNRIGHELAIAEVEQDLLELRGDGVEGDGLVANPARAALAEQVKVREGEVAKLEAELAELERQLAKETARIARLVEGYKVYEQKVAMIDETRLDRERQKAKLDQATEIQARLDNQPTVRQEVKANPPPRPTEPNILVVALIGCVLGLAVAIALILLLDVMQGSFKTVEDVERALAVPVLGGMSHLETVEERMQTARGRRRVSLAAAAFLCLCVAVVTIFYIDPTRLPSFARDLLSMLLGN